MRKAEELLQRLGIMNFTKRQLHIINEFISNKETNCEKLLNQLGSWDVTDLDICERWLNER